MADRDVLPTKAATIHRYLARIAKITDFDHKSLDDIDRQDIFVLNLQRAVQAAIDLAIGKPKYKLFVMTPHAEDFDGTKGFNHLIDKAMLNVYSP